MMFDRLMICDATKESDARGRVSTLSKQPIFASLVYTVLYMRMLSYAVSCAFTSISAQINVRNVT